MFLLHGLPSTELCPEKVKRSWSGKASILRGYLLVEEGNDRIFEGSDIVIMTHEPDTNTGEPDIYSPFDSEDDHR